MIFSLCLELMSLLQRLVGDEGTWHFLFSPIPSPAHYKQLAGMGWVEGGVWGVGWSTSILKKCQLKRLFFYEEIIGEATKSAVKNQIYCSDWKGTEGKSVF